MRVKKYILFFLWLLMQRRQRSFSENPVSTVDYLSAEEPSTEEGEWDSFQEDPTYLSPTQENSQRLAFDKDSRRHSTTDENILDTLEFWPPRILSDEPSIQEGYLVSVNLWDSEEEEEVFVQSESTTMAPPHIPVESPAAAIYAEFLEQFNTWKDDYKFVTEANAADLNEDDLKGVEEGFQKIDDLHVQVKKADPNHAVNFPDLKTNRQNAFRDKRSYVKSIKDYMQRNTAVANENARTSAFEDDIEKFLEENKVNFAIWKSRATSVQNDMTKIMEEFPTPTSLQSD